MIVNWIKTKTWLVRQVAAGPITAIVWPIVPGSAFSSIAREYLASSGLQVIYKPIDAVEACFFLETAR